mmetsp:Transcript_21359/g.46549  ORF Transcript_21359/g.46549 Transcript_21359/m.46549 type:complete len:694 (+) Transcript_21359:155-2236(+)
MHQTAPLGRMATTHHGMRRILKRRPAVTDYIRQSVETGVYNNPDAYQNRRGGGRRGGGGRQDQFGANVNPYPKYYEILSLNPPIPKPAKITRQLRRERSKMNLPTDHLIKSYLRRHDERVRSTHPPTEAELEEARYAKLLGLSTPATSDAMGRKSVVLSNAYTFAVKQYDVLRADDARGGDMTEEESIQVVEQLLAEEAARERRRSREAAEEAAKWREVKNNAAKTAATSSSGTSADTASGEDKSDGTHEKSEQVLTNDDDVEPPSASGGTTMPSVLTGKPRALRAMTIWSRRLAAVPYNRWTVGASAALDHWIAIEVLGLSEESWEKILAGDDGEDDEVMTGRGEGGAGVGIGSNARAIDIVAVRTALFPETVIYGDEDEEDVNDADADLDAAAQDDDSTDETQKSIDELLASLSELGGDEDDEDWSFVSKEDDGTRTAAAGEIDEELDERVADMVDALQNWREKNTQTPYEKWGEDEKTEFEEWLSQYVELVSTESDGQVDMAATREALLSEPPMTRDESDAFWSNIRDETQAEIFLSNLRIKTGSDSDESVATFLQLPHDVQVRRLVDLGTLRPLFDEYTPESVRLSFLRRYADVLLDGAEVEHLVSDPKGPITSDDLAGDATLLDEADRGTRFRIEKIKYGTDEFGTASSQRGRMLYRAWNEQKAGRARYEEAMFKKGKLGLERKPAKK